MKRFYVTFGMGTLLRNYHAIIDAYNRDIVGAWLRDCGYKYSSIYEKEPTTSTRLRDEPEVLHYSDASHI